MNHSEALAKGIIEGVEAGAQMIYRENQSVRTHDFDLHRSAAAIAAVEVTSVTDGGVKATYAAIDRHRRIPRKLCANDWRTHPAPNANIKRIAEKADAYLARIEASGIDSFFSSSDASQSPSVAAIWRDLSVNGGRVLPWREPGIGIALPVTGGAVGVGLLMAAVDQLASTPDNIEKLASSGAAERGQARSRARGRACPCRSCGGLTNRLQDIVERDERNARGRPDRRDDLIVVDGVPDSPPLVQAAPPDRRNIPAPERL